MIEVQPVRKPLDATIEVPGSKSYTNRALLVAAMARGVSTLTGALFSDDTRYMSASLRKLGVNIEADEAQATFDVHGNGGEIPVSSADLYIGNSGTTSRSLTAYLSLGRGRFVIDGDEPMRRGRPISDLLDALRQIGVSARSQFENGHLPVIVEADGLEGGKTRLDVSKSSQFLTALLLIAPYAKKGIEIEVIGKREMPYIAITLAVMAAFGVQVINEDYKYFRIEGGQQYQPRVYRQIGVSARSQFENGHLPVIVEADGLEGGKTRLDVSKSSQFLTALLLIAPYAKKGMEIEVIGKREMPYIDITLAVMAAFGVQVINEDYKYFRIEGGQQYQPRDYNIEPDASNASYFFAAAALTGGRVTVQHLHSDSAQGDVQFIHILEQMGCQTTVSDTGITVTGPRQLKGIDVDMRTISDTALTLAAIAPFADSKVTIKNIEHTRWQETDRIHAMVTELRKLGVPVVEHQDGLEISPAPITPAAIDTYEDHRMAMAFSLVGLKASGIRINDPECVSKTFPNYFEVLRELYS